jgi:hypothetical protein
MTRQAFLIAARGSPVVRTIPSPCRSDCKEVDKRVPVRDRGLHASVGGLDDRALGESIYRPLPSELGKT